MSQLPHNLYTPEQVRELDSIAIKEHEISGTVLMERAGTAAFNLLLQRWPEVKTITVLCGTGNNGGDGFVIARLAHEKQYQVKVFQLGDASHIQGDALAALQRLEGAGVSVEAWTSSEALTDTDVIVDALLGTGFEGDVRDDFKQAINAANNSKAGILAIDVPSGLNAETAGVASAVIKANVTISFIGMKQGLFTGKARNVCGELVFDDLRVPETIYEKQTPSAQLIDYEQLKGLLTKRAPCAHKGQFGHVLIIGGDYGMSGAVRMAGEAAQRVGAGLVSIATRKHHAAIISSSRPELMCHGVEFAIDLKPLLEKATVVAIGPGLGTSKWAEELKSEVMTTELPMVVDADAINLLAKEKFRRENWVLTPHPGEAARLLDVTSGEIQNNRFAMTQQLAEQFNGTIVLKGAGTLILKQGEPTAICNEGNPGMASGGMGDVLTGVIAGLMAQGLAPFDAARFGVCIHARAADMAVGSIGERGLLATDLMSGLRRLVNP
jgi:NAD(P)H-hydrate epimerase